jgi:predicted double-glycine peptidase
MIGIICRRRAMAALLPGTILAAGMAVAGERPVRSLLEMRHDRVVVQEWDLSCGAAALATLLRHQHGDTVTERDIALGLVAREEYVENPELVRLRQGFSLLDLKRYADSRGYIGVGFGGLGLDDLIERAPIMTPIRRHGYNHFVIVRGRLGDRILLADPAFGTRTVTVEQFGQIWLDFGQIGKVGFVVTRDGSIAPPGDLAPRPDEFLTLG